MSQVDRVATEDLEIGGQLIRAGEFVMMNLLAGNWDAEFVDNPGAFDVEPKHPWALGFWLRRAPMHRSEPRPS